MKILIYGRGVPNKQYPQEGCFEWDQARSLKAYGHDIVYMYVDGRWRNRHHKWGITEEYIDGIKVYKIYYGTLSILQRIAGIKIENIIAKYLGVRLFKYVINRNPNIDVVHSHYIYNAYRSLAFKKILNVPLVATEHLSTMVFSKIPKLLDSLGKQTYKNLDALITVSPFLQKSIENRFNVSSHVCGNVLSSEFEKLNLNKNKINNGIFKFVACGSLIKRKGFDVLIRAASMISIPKDKWIVEIIGSGPFKKNLESLIRDCSLENNIFLTGQKSKEQIIESYKNADCFILSSRSETFGVVLIEAMAAGLPSIVTKCGGADGIINDKCGIYIPIDDADALKIAMENMFNNSTIYDHEIIRNTCLSHYSSNSIAKELTNVYESTISKS